MRRVVLTICVLLIAVSTANGGPLTITDLGGWLNVSPENSENIAKLYGQVPEHTSLVFVAAGLFTLAGAMRRRAVAGC